MKKFLSILMIVNFVLAKNQIEPSKIFSKKQIIQILKKEARKGNLKAELKLAKIYKLKNSQEKALYWYKKAAYKSAEANYQIGKIYEDLNKSSLEIVKYYNKAAKKNNIKALFALANIYYQGKIIPKDIKKAISLYKKAANKGDKFSIYNLGYIYEHAEGVDKNLTEAFNYYYSAAKKGYLNAKYNVAAFYYEGKGVKQDKKKAFQWFKEAAKDGDIESIYNVGLMYYRGEGVLKNKIYAFNYLLQAAKWSHQKAQVVLDSLCKESPWACR